MREWLYCPKRNKKTKVKVYEQTKLDKFPFFCLWCKTETVVNVENYTVVVVFDDKKEQT
ncbi:MAG: conjugal transfer protein [Clostridia bacterium]|nr:conjugal transfer protein [Clostridia bacterium]